MNKKNILKFLVVAINGCLGLILGWIVGFGFLNINHIFLILLIMMISGFLHIYIWLKYFQSGNQRKGILKAIVSLQLLIFLALGSVFFSQRITYQNLPVLSNDYEKSFDKLWEAMDDVYPYFDLKNVNWEKVYEMYHPMVIEAKNDQEYFQVIGKMLGELRDAHTDILNPNLDRRLFASVKNRGDLAIVDQIGYSAEMAGLQPGMILLRIGGKPIEDLISEIDISLNQASTPWSRKVRAYNQLLAVPLDENEILQVAVLDKSGKELELEIRQLESPVSWVSKYSGAQSDGVYFEKINDTIGYIRVDRLWNNNDDIVQKFDQCLDELMDMPGIILDLRQNGGGDSRIAEKIAGRFISEPFMYGQDVVKKRIYKFVWRKSVNYTVKPRGETYTGKLVILTDYTVMSSAEWLVGMLGDNDRAISIGRVTGGATGNPIKFSIAGGTVRYSTAIFTRPDGSLVEGQGYLPDIYVDWRMEDYIKGIDPDIQAAIDWMEAQE